MNDGKIIQRFDPHLRATDDGLGHSTITTTLDLYSHVTDTMQSDAAARLDAAFRPAISRVAGTT
jgi:integrase